MTAKQKQFILKKLIPFILREQGRGFEMSAWGMRVEDTYTHPNLQQVIKAPKCGTACCIGGSIDMLNGLVLEKYFAPDFYGTGEQIGLYDKQVDTLFYSYNWPNPFRGRYRRASTPLDQAKIAVALLKEVVRTEGKCLDD